MSCSRGPQGAVLMRGTCAQRRRCRERCRRPCMRRCTHQMVGYKPRHFCPAVAIQHGKECSLAAPVRKVQHRGVSVLLQAAGTAAAGSGDSGGPAGRRVRAPAGAGPPAGLLASPFMRRQRGTPREPNGAASNRRAGGARESVAAATPARDPRLPPSAAAHHVRAPALHGGDAILVGVVLTLLRLLRRAAAEGARRRRRWCGARGAAVARRCWHGAPCRAIDGRCARCRPPGRLGGRPRCPEARSGASAAAPVAGALPWAAHAPGLHGLPFPLQAD